LSSSFVIEKYKPIIYHGKKCCQLSEIYKMVDKNTSDEMVYRLLIFFSKLKVSRFIFFHSTFKTIIPYLL